MTGRGTRYYANINRAKIDMMIKELSSHGAVITGGNPWDIATRQHGIILRGEWSEATLTLALSVMDSNWYVPRDMIWDNIDPLMRHIQALETA
jgi:hypothetical protein